MSPPNNVTVVIIYDEAGLVLDEIWYPKARTPTLSKLFAKYPLAARITVT